MVQTRYRYRCEKCGTEFDVKAFAEACESLPVHPCGVKAGDAVEVFDAYGSPQPDVVVDVKLTSPIDFVSHGDERIWNPERLLNHIKTFARHNWIIQLPMGHQTTKDDWSSQCDWGLVRRPGGSHWLDGSPCDTTHKDGE